MNFRCCLILFLFFNINFGFGSEKLTPDQLIELTRKTIGGASERSLSFSDQRAREIFERIKRGQATNIYLKHVENIDSKMKSVIGFFSWLVLVMQSQQEFEEELKLDNPDTSELKVIMERTSWDLKPARLMFHHPMMKPLMKAAEVVTRNSDLYYKKIRIGLEECYGIKMRVGYAGLRVDFESNLGITKLEPVMEDLPSKICSLATSSLLWAFAETIEDEDERFQFKLCLTAFLKFSVTPYFSKLPLRQLLSFKSGLQVFEKYRDAFTPDANVPIADLFFQEDEQNVPTEALKAIYFEQNAMKTLIEVIKTREFDIADICAPLKLWEIVILWARNHNQSLIHDDFNKIQSLIVELNRADTMCREFNEKVSFNENGFYKSYEEHIIWYRRAFKQYADQYARIQKRINAQKLGVYQPIEKKKQKSRKSNKKGKKQKNKRKGKQKPKKPACKKINIQKTSDVTFVKKQKDTKSLIESYQIFEEYKVAGSFVQKALKKEPVKALLRVGRWSSSDLNVNQVRSFGDCYANLDAQQIAVQVFNHQGVELAALLDIIPEHWAVPHVSVTSHNSSSRPNVQRSFEVLQVQKAVDNSTVVSVQRGFYHLASRNQSDDKRFYHAMFHKKLDEIVILSDDDEEDNEDENYPVNFIDDDDEKSDEISYFEQASNKHYLVDFVFEKDVKKLSNNMICNELLAMSTPKRMVRGFWVLKYAKTNFGVVEYYLPVYFPSK